MAKVHLEKVVGFDGKDAKWNEVAGTQFEDTTYQPKEAYDKAQGLYNSDPGIYQFVATAALTEVLGA
jgi:hypothetical protein